MSYRSKAPVCCFRVMCVEVRVNVDRAISFFARHSNKFSHMICSVARFHNICFHPRVPILLELKAYGIKINHISFLHSDGLVDCMDPDCCSQSPCLSNPLCRGSRDPLQIIQQSQSAGKHVSSFYDRIKMLVGRDSTHIVQGSNPFNAR